MCGTSSSSRLYGEVQKEVIQETLANDFDIDVGFRQTTTICIERPIGTGAAVEIIGEAPNPFAATVGLRVDPAAINSGVEFRLEVELGSIPLPFHKAVEESVYDTLRQGLSGWQVTDCTVTMTHSGFWPRPGSRAGDFRNLTPLVLISALQQADTVVCEPIHRFHLEVPADTLGPILPALARLHAVPRSPVIRGSSCTLEGEIPAARVHELQLQLPGLTRTKACSRAPSTPINRFGARPRPGRGTGPQPTEPQGLSAPRSTGRLTPRRDLDTQSAGATGRRQSSARMPRA